MRTIELKVYKFSELSEKAKDKAMQDFASTEGFVWAEDYKLSLDRLAKHFGGAMVDYNLDFFSGKYTSYAIFEMPDMSQEEIAEKLTELGAYNPETLKGLGDCKLTGFCADESAIDGFRKAFMSDGETDLDQLMQAAFTTWIEAANADCEAQYSYGSFSYFSDANNYEYYEDGKLV